MISNWELLYYGVTFGIVLMTIVYTLIRYIYSKELFYFSYCLMQIFSLIYILAYSKLFEIKLIYEELSLTFASISALVFAINFFEGRFLPKIETYKELFLNTLLLNIVLITSFYHYSLFEYIPYTIIYAILFISIVFNLKKSFNSTFIYVIGWSIFCYVLFIFDLKHYYLQKGLPDIVLVAFTIEAILFTISLSYKYNSLKQEKKEYENMLFQQSKLAKSGEMLANITHQFRQPLNNLSYIFINLNNKFEKGNLNKEYFNKKLTQANSQIDFLSKTIQDFKEFYTPNKVKENFYINEAILNVKSILQADLKKYNITFDLVFKTNEQTQIYGIKNEFLQVVLSLLSNSIDSLKDIENPKISIEISSNNSENIISFIDNGKGIQNNLINTIFKPYFTTKKEGMGLGLFLVKQIIEESFEGKIEVENLEKGCSFTLFFEKTI